MPTLQDQKAAVLFLNKVAASNNPVAAIAALKRHGYQTQFDILPADQIENALLGMYVSNPSTYFAVLKEIPYKSDITNWTTAPDTKNKIQSIASQFGYSTPSTGKFDWSNVWSNVVNLISGGTTTTPGSDTQTSQPAVKPLVLIILALIAIISIILTSKFVKDDKTKKWIIIGIVVVMAFVVIYSIFAKSTTTTHVGGSTHQTSGIGGFISGLTGGSLGGWISGLFGGGQPQQYKCDCNKPGYTTDGQYKDTCKEGRIDYQIDCGA